MLSTDASPSSKQYELVGPRVSRRGAERAVPLSWEQEQIWAHGLLHPDLPLYNETVSIRYRGSLDLSALDRAVSSLCERHDILTTVIREMDGVWLQFPGIAPVARVDRADVSEIEDNDARAQASARLGMAAARQPFDLLQGPLVRVLAVRHREAESAIYVTIHHALFDGMSLRNLLLPELVRLYEAAVLESDATMPQVPLHYADYAHSQSIDTGSRRSAGVDFWRATLHECPALPLPTDRPRVPTTSQAGGVCHFDLGDTFTAELRSLARAERTTLFNVLLSGFAALLARYADTEDVVVGTTYGGRSSTELEKVFGCFLNTIVLRIDASGEPSFRELLKRVRDTTLDAMENADIPFQEVVREAPAFAKRNSPPIQVAFTFQPPVCELPDEWEMDVFAVGNGTCKFDLHLDVEERNGSLRGRLQYNSELFDPATVERIQGHWQTLLRSAVREANSSIWTLRMLRAEEQHWLLETLNDTQQEFPQQCVHDLFAMKALEHPDRIAISHRGREISYRQLDRWSVQLADILQQRGAGPGSVVGVMMERTPEMIAALLGVLRAGAAYLPLDPRYPAARLQQMIRGSGAALLLTQASLRDQAPNHTLAVLDAPALLDGLDPHAPPPALVPVDVSTPAYLIFTSGSTGVPKGVEVVHSGLTNLLCSMRDLLGFTEQDVLLALTSISFDIAMLEIFLPLLTGARLELASSTEAADPDLLAQKLIQSGATIMQATPATWRMLIENGWSGAAQLKALCGGEAMSEALANDLLSRCATLWNLYGPTETTIWSTCVKVQDRSMPIILGQPIANTQIYLLDSRGSLVPPGVCGEIYISGEGLAKGYCGQPELTAERFPLLSLDEGAVVRAYRTGDRGKRLHDGSLVFLGRIDRQIKLRGFRIEPGEIEHTVRSLSGVQDCIVALVPAPSQAEVLAAYVLPHPGAVLESEELREGIGRLLPSYMQPSVFHVLTEIPLTPNGKVDRKRLPRITETPDTRRTELPRPGMEQRLSAIWTDLLGGETPGRRDNFFDVGGHSLLAARFLSKVHKTLGQKFSLASFVQAPTIEQFARVVEGCASPERQLLRSGSALGAPLFWVGADPWLIQMGRQFRDSISLCTLSLPSNAFTSPSTCRIETMAARLLEHIRVVQPEGPYVMGGFCLQALVAMEIAQQLQRAGEKVALLIIGDLFAPDRLPGQTRFWKLKRRARWQLFHAAALLRSPLKAWPDYLTRRLYSLRYTRKCSQAAVKERPLDLQEALHVAGTRYQASSFSGKVLFLESAQGELSSPTNAESWSHVLSDVDVFRYPGDHESLMRNPVLTSTAQRIQQAVDHVLSASAALGPSSTLPREVASS